MAEQDMDLSQEGNIQESNPLVAAVIENDFNTLKSLIQSGHSVNSKSSKSGKTLSYHIVEHERVEMLDYILALEDEGVVHLRNCVEDIPGSTLLHLMSLFTGDNNRLKLTQLVIERGVDVNVQAKDGTTPLYYACKRGNFDLVYLLLYYGALATIPSGEGILPLAVLPRTSIPEEDHAHLIETLFDLTFEADCTTTINFPTLLAAIETESPLIPKLMQVNSEVDYDFDELEGLYKKFWYFNIKHFKVFANIFDGNILQDLVENFPILTKLIDCSLYMKVPEVKGFILTLLESNYVDALVQISSTAYPIIGKFIQMWNEEEEVTKIVCLMLSHGLHISSKDLDMVYSRYGYCDLFKILLHMDVILVKNPYGISLARLYYDINVNIKEFSEDATIASCVLDYYNHPKLREVCLNSNKAEIVDKCKKWPEVPHLIELSRNAAKGYLIDRYKIENSRQFYTILKWLPSIDEICKKVLSFEKKLYWL